MTLFYSLLCQLQLPAGAAKVQCIAIEIERRFRTKHFPSLLHLISRTAAIFLLHLGGNFGSKSAFSVARACALAVL